MTGREWKPGDVAIGDGPMIFHQRVKDAELMFVNQHGYRHPARTATKAARPAIVVDPAAIPVLGEFSDYPDEALRILAEGVEEFAGDDLDATQEVLRWLADQMPQSSPPKPEEPTGLGAVVIEDGLRWTRAVRVPGSFPWVGERGGVRGWSEFSERVRVLSEGAAS